MKGLSAGDLLAVLGVIHDVAGAGGRDEFDASALRGLTGLVRSDVTSLNEIDPAAGRLVFLAEPPSFVFPDEASERFAELAHQHPLIRQHLASGDGSAIKVSDFLDRAAWHQTEIYRRFFAWVGVEHQMSITLPAPAPIVVGFAFNRSDRDFDERDRGVLNLVRPHLAQSWRRAREYERLDALLGAATGALDQAGSGVIVLSDPAQELTAGAMVSLYRFFGRPAPHDPFPPRVRHWLDGQVARSRDASSGLELARPLRAGLDNRQLVLRYLPGVHGRADMILLDERATTATSTLQQIGLTEREVTVLQLVGSGAGNAEIARQLSLSIWTVKRHLGNIYAKLGVSSRVRAAALALEIDTHHRATPSGSGAD